MIGKKDNGQSQLKPRLVAVDGKRTTDPVDDKFRLEEKALSTYEEEKIEWLWEPYIPIGMVTILEGEGEVGKSRLTRYIAARLTAGRPLPGQEEAVWNAANVLVVSFSEDPVASVVKPQVRKMGGDQDKLFIVEQPFTLDEEGIEALSGVMERIEPLLIIMDPLTDYIPSRANTYKDDEVRRMVMGPLTALAREYDCAILAIRHFRKGSDGSNKYRGAGSMAFTNVARATIACIQDSEDENITVVGVNKGNLVHRSKKISRRFEIVETLDGIGRLVWRGTTDKSLDDIEAERKERSRDADLEKQAKEFLTELLSKGPMLMQKIKERAEAHSFSWSTVERAKRSLNVKSRGGYRGAPSEWYLCDDEKH